MSNLALAKRVDLILQITRCRRVGNLFLDGARIFWANSLLRLNIPWVELTLRPGQFFAASDIVRFRTWRIKCRSPRVYYGGNERGEHRITMTRAKKRSKANSRNFVDLRCARAKAEKNYASHLHSLALCRLPNKRRERLKPCNYFFISFCVVQKRNAGVLIAKLFMLALCGFWSGG